MRKTGKSSVLSELGNNMLYQPTDQSLSLALIFLATGMMGCANDDTTVSPVSNAISSEESAKGASNQSIVGTWCFDGLPNIEASKKQIVFHDDGSLDNMGLEGNWQSPEKGVLNIQLDDIVFGPGGGGRPSNTERALYKFDGDNLLILRANVKDKSVDDPNLNWNHASLYHRCE